MSNLTICGVLCMPSHWLSCAFGLIQPLQYFRQSGGTNYCHFDLISYLVVCGVEVLVTSQS
ncbi:hypothetical protein YC2023_079886 [Brassica napus]